jgi:pimeloyl-[acyl-carrier protein] methyl ester esterase
MTEVVILPGLDGTAKLHGAFIAQLGELGVRARAIAYPPDQSLGYEELELLVRSQLLSSEQFILLAESFSGPLATQIAAHPPPGLVGLVLSTTFASTPVPALKRLAPLLRFAPDRPPESLLSWLLLGAWATPDLRLALGAALRQVSPIVIRSRAAAALRVDVTALLPSVTLPVLQLVAGHDRLLARAVTASLGKGLPNCRTVIVPGPHLLLQTSSELCAKKVAAFALGLGPNNSFKPTPLRGAA